MTTRRRFVTWDSAGRRPRVHPRVAAVVARSPVVESDRTGLPLSDVLEERARVERLRTHTEEQG